MGGGGTLNSHDFSDACQRAARSEQSLLLDVPILQGSERGGILILRKSTHGSFVVTGWWFYYSNEPFLQ